MKKLVPHFGRKELYSEWGRSPVGEEGVFSLPRETYSLFLIGFKTKTPVKRQGL